MKILFVDIETKPLIAHVWGLWENNVGLNQVESDWSILSWAAKWRGEKLIRYQDNRKSKNLDNDKKLLNSIWKLLDEADVVVTQNGKKFDVPKLNARFIINGMQPPSSFKQIDTCQIARKKFGFTSNKLEYLSEKLCTKYKKLKHKRFPGHEMWTECLKGNQAAWKEMEKYNKHDVLALEELYTKLIPWDTGNVNFNVYNPEPTCGCGSTKFIKRGFFFTGTGKFQRYRCNKCGSETRSGKNLIVKGSIRQGTVR